MTKTSSLVSLLFLCLPGLVTCDDIETPQGNISIAILQQLQSAYGVAINQKEQESLFLTLPLVAPNDKDLVAVGNISTANATPFQSRSENFAVGHHDKRQGTRCSHRLRFEGDDACRGYENMPGYVACRQPCQFTRDSMSGPGDETLFVNNILSVCRTPWRTCAVGKLRSWIATYAVDELEGSNSQAFGIKSSFRA
ncbi:hypothetical protein J3E74DRAFT_293844 [Bipolaris maydis]|nr:hypothetical protein J3E74DRAFT_293844 [Bipolaris maydis]